TDRFVLEGRKRCVATHEADREEGPPIRAQRYAFLSECQKKSNDEASGDIDKECSVWERGSETACETASNQVTRGRADPAAQGNQEDRHCPRRLSPLRGVPTTLASSPYVRQLVIGFDQRQARE